MYLAESNVIVGVNLIIVSIEKKYSPQKLGKSNNIKRGEIKIIP